MRNKRETAETKERNYRTYNKCHDNEWHYDNLKHHKRKQIDTGRILRRRNSEASGKRGRRSRFGFSCTHGVRLAVCSRSRFGLQMSRIVSSVIGDNLTGNVTGVRIGFTTVIKSKKHAVFAHSSYCGYVWVAYGSR